MEPTMRVATPADADAIDSLMKESGANSRRACSRMACLLAAACSRQKI